MKAKALATLVIVAGALCSASTAAAATWSYTASPLTTPRFQSHTLTVMADGRALLAGGLVGTSSTAATASAEQFDPATGQWTVTESMALARSRHSATLLLDGRVLVAGGRLADDTQTTTAELYDPVTDAWSSTGAMNVPRDNFTATRLVDGRVLVSGGVSGDGKLGAAHNVTKSSEIYNPATGTWTETDGMAHARFSHRETLLPDGRVLVTGGTGYAGHCVSRDTVEIFDPASSRWSIVASMASARSAHISALLPGGRPLVAGGWGMPVKGCISDFTIVSPVAGTEIYDPTADSWSPAGNLVRARGAAAFSSLPGGRVLAAGGRVPGPPGQDPVRTATAEVFDPATNAWSATATMNALRTGAVMVTLHDGRALVVGGSGGLGSDAPTTGELYVP